MNLSSLASTKDSFTSFYTFPLSWYQKDFKINYFRSDSLDKSKFFIPRRCNVRKMAFGSITREFSAHGKFDDGEKRQFYVSIFCLVCASMKHGWKLLSYINAKNVRTAKKTPASESTDEPRRERDDSLIRKQFLLLHFYRQFFFFCLVNDEREVIIWVSLGKASTCAMRTKISCEKSAMRPMRRTAEEKLLCHCDIKRKKKNCRKKSNLRCPNFSYFSQTLFTKCCFKVNQNKRMKTHRKYSFLLSKTGRSFLPGHELIVFVTKSSNQFSIITKTQSILINPKQFTQ